MSDERLKFHELIDRLNQLEASEVLVIGIDRLIIDPKTGSVAPDINEILDLSALNDHEVEASIASARKFVSRFGQDPNERFDLVL
ncbi:MAG: hypothetical protein AAFR98_04365 [Pseudomonadota bacterium]